MKAGDYVRTKYGSIYKIDEIGEYSGFVYSTDSTIIQGIIKSSPNIIDLIEVGDIITLKSKYCIDAAFRVLGKSKKFIELDLFGDGETVIENGDDIKSIVTKEQFESMEYKVGE